MDIRDLISKMNIEEKFALLTGRNLWQTASVDRLEIPSITVSDGPYGLRKVNVDEGGKEITVKAVCFPTGSALAATWNPELVGDIGSALGEECRAEGVDLLLGPGINIKRTPLCGRNFEYFSEDPLLAGELAAAYIKGVQEQGVGTSLKHFATNNQEFDRHQISSEVDMRTLREIYLKPFEIAVKKAKPWSVMCAYNRLNGLYCSENRFLLNDVLRKEWGFEGIVVSDWSAVHDRVKALKASLELEMPFNDKSAAALKDAYENGRIDDQEMDWAVERLLNIVFQAQTSRKPLEKYDADSHHKLAKKAALEAITLLKNEDDILPVAKHKVRKIAVIGQYAKEPLIQGGGSAKVEPIRIDSPLDRMVELSGDEIEISFMPAYFDYNWTIAVNGLNNAMECAAVSDMAIVFVGNRDTVETECFDRGSISLLPDMENIILRIAEQNENTVVVVQAGSAVDMSRWIDKVKGVVFTWYTGQAGGSALAEVIFGLVNPSGKIAETFPVRIEDTPSYSTYPGNGFVSWYAEGLMVGYRYYDTYGKNVLFPFGHGLSYTKFEYSDLSISPVVANESGNVTVSLKIKNTGRMEGMEVVQLYVRDMVCKTLRPYKELKAFKKVDLQQEEEKEVLFSLGRDAFAYFSTSLNKWCVESGDFQILIGSSSRDIRLSGFVKIKAENDFS